MENSNGASAPKHRSPAYPGISLRVAVDKIRILYPVMKKNAISIESALETLNLKQSAGSRVIAALIMYGFLLDEGSGSARKVKLSQTGYKFSLLSEDDSDYTQIIREAALGPKIFREMMQQWPDSLPPDSTIRKFLTIEKHYNPDAVPGLIRDFKETYAFANLADSDKLTAGEGDIEEDENPATNTMSGTEAVQFERTSPSSYREPEAKSVPSTPFTTQTAGYPSLPLVKDGMKTLTIQLPDLREALLYLPSDYNLDDLESIKDHINLWGKLLQRPPKINQEVEIRFGEAIWQNEDGDQPVFITGYLGEHNGRKYVSIKGSKTGIPFEEISYEI